MASKMIQPNLDHLHLPKNSMVLWLQENGFRTPLRLYIKDKKGLYYREFQQRTIIKNKRVERTWVLERNVVRNVEQHATT